MSADKVDVMSSEVGSGLKLNPANNQKMDGVTELDNETEATSSQRSIKALIEDIDKAVGAVGDEKIDGKNGATKKKRRPRKSKKAVDGKKGGESGTSTMVPAKRAISNQNTPEGIVKNAAKKTKPEERDGAITFSSAVQSEKFAVVPDNYPTTMMNVELVQHLEEFIVRGIDEMEVGDEGPKFHYRRLVDGYLKVACIGQQSRIWLEGMVKRLETFGGKLKIVPLDSLPRPPMIRARFPLPIVTDEIILRRLKIQNRDCDMSSWKPMRRFDKDICQVVYFSADNSSVAYLKKNNLFLSYLITQVKFQLLNDAPGENELPEKLETEDGAENN